MKKHFFTLITLCIAFNIAYSANHLRTCSSASVLQRQLLENPKMQLQRSRIESFTNDFVARQLNGQNSRTQAVSVTIPVVFHVIYNTAAQNVSDQMLLDQLRVLNEDYGGRNADTSGIPSVFQSVKAHNTNIQFCLAQRDPSGASTTGITRTSTTVTSFIDDDLVKFASSGGHDIWDRNKYLNIWICNLGASLLGYAQFPGGPANTDGVVILFSSLPGGDAPFDLGRSATHEVGHWLNLSHIWGDANCGNDFVSDTPTQAAANGGCPTFPSVTCSNGPNGDMFMNYMDYTDDACMFMFTAGQGARMDALFATGGDRVSLLTSNGCTPPVPAKPIADFSATPTSVCPGNTVKFTDLSQNLPTSWSWTFAGGTPATSTSQNPTITYNSAGVYAVTLRATNSLGFDDTVKTSYITVATPTGTALPFTQGFQGTFPPTGWSLVSNSGFNWEKSTSAGGFGTSTASAYFYNWNNDANDLKDDLVTPVLNLTGATSPRLKFDVAYARYSNNSKDTLEVLISDACSSATTSIYKKGGSNLSTTANTTNDFVPTGTQWRKDSVAIPAAFFNKNVKVYFRNYGAYGNNIYIDNINLYSTGTVTTPTVTASFTASDTVVCPGSSLTFTNASTATNGTLDSVRWTIPGGTPATSNSTTTVVPTFNTTGTYVISLTAYTHNGTTVIASTAFTKSIRVKAKPNVTLSYPDICSGSTATITASGATNYTWTGGLPSVSNPTTPVLTTTTTYTVTGTTSGCTNTAVAVITVNPKPNVTVTSPSICSGQTAQPVASGATSYTWTGGLSSVSNPTTPALTTTTTYTVTGSNGICSKTAVSTVTVSSSLNVTVTSPAICAGQTAQPVASGATTYTWTGGLTSVSNPTTPVLTTTTTYTVTGSSGSCSKTAIATITVTALPNVTVNSPSICAGQTAQPIAGGATSYTWTGGLTSVSNPTTPILTTTTVYTVTGTTGSCSKTAVTTVTVTPLPSVTVTSPGICTGLTASIQANGATTYTWTGGLASISNPTTPVLTTTTTYTVTGTTGSCSKTAVSTVTVASSLNVTVTSPSICAGETAHPVASGGSTYTWTGGLTSVSNPTTPVLNTTTTYTVTGSSGSCSKTAVSTVTVKPVPGTPSITQSNDTLYSNVIVVGASYEWYKAGVLQTTTSTPYYKFPSSGIYTVIVNNNECPSNSSANFNAVLTGFKNHKLDVELSIVPNPNNGSFDINITSGVNKNYQLKLFNLSGQILFDEDMNVRVGQNSKHLNLTGIDKGAYFLSIISNDGISTQNIIVQ
jgi:PKD repeat protein